MTAARNLATPWRVRKLFLLACSLIPLAVVFWLNFNFVLAHFFKVGAYLYDTGLMGGLIHEPTLGLDVPVAATGAMPRSFYVDHMTPTLWLIGLPSWVFHVNYIHYSAAVFAAVATGPSAALAFVLWQLFRRGRLKGATARVASVMAAAPLALAFSGTVLRAVSYPHYELLLIPFATLFFVFAAQRRLLAAAIAFAICVLTREDFALHLFGFIFVWVVFQAWVEHTGSREVRYWLKWMAASGVAGVTIILIQRLFFLRGGGLLFRVYLGWPPFEHVDLGFVATRIHVLATGRLDLLVCLASAAACSIWRRDARYVLGYLACVPWLVLNLLAREQPAGTLNLYYAFPFVLAMIWPVLVLLLSHETAQPSPLDASARHSMPGHALAVAAISTAGFIGSTFAYAQSADLGGMLANMRPVPAELRAAGLSFQRLLADGLLDRERIGTDHAVAALLPRVVRREQIVTADNLRDFRAVAFYATSLSAESKIGLLIDAGYTRAAEVGASSLYIAARPSADTEQLLQRLSKDGLQLSDRSYLMSRMRVGEAGVRRDTSIAAVGTDGLIAFGPYVRLPAGSYRALFTIVAEDCAQASDGSLELAVTSGFGSVSLAKRSVATRNVFTAARGCTATIDLDFTLDQRQAAHPVETPVRRSGGGRYILTDIQLLRVEQIDGWHMP